MGCDVAARLDLVIEAGATFAYSLTWNDAAGTPVDVTGYKARMQFRTDYAATDPFLELTTENGGIVVGAAAGRIDLLISAVDTDAIAEPGGVYDLELESGGGVVTRLLMGGVSISPQVTR